MTTTAHTPANPQRTRAPMDSVAKDRATSSGCCS